MKAHIHKDFTRESLSKHFVYESYDEERQFFFNRGSVGFVLFGWALVGANLQAQNEVEEFLKSEENLPAGSTMQVLMIGSSRIDEFLFNWQSYRRGEIFCELAKKRVEFLRHKAVEEGTIKDIVLLISITVPSVNANLNEMERRREALKNTFSSIGLKTEDVNAEKLLSFIRIIFGWKEEEHEEINPHEILASQVLSRDFALYEDDNLVMLNDNQAFIALEAAKRPAEWRLSLMDLFLGNEMRKGEYIKSNFLIHFGVQILPNQLSARSSAITKREALGRNIAAGMSKFFPDLESEARDMDEAVALLQMGNRVAHILLNVIMWDKKEKAEKSASQFCSMLRKSGFYFVPCKYDHLAMTLASMPMQLVEEDKSLIGNKIIGLGVGLSLLGRGKKTVSSESKALLPIIGEWKGDLSSPGLLLTGRRSQIMYWSPFGSSLLSSVNTSLATPNENFNLCIAGVPGSGKSVFMQELMLSILGVGGKVFVLDYGRSFKRSCLILKGSYIEFDASNPISINPFSQLPEGVDAKSNEAKQDFLSNFPSILSAMAAPIHGTTDLQQAMLQKALIAVVNEKGRKAEITDIADWLLQREEAYGRELGNMLFPFTRDGQHGKFFSGDAKISLNADIVVIETDHLRSVPELLTVIVQIMIVHINQTMVKGDRNRPFGIMIDEAWKLLAGKRSGEFIEEAGRIARKYNGSIMLATQQLTDYFRQEGSASEKAFENASHKIILKQNPESFKAMRANPKLAGFVDEDWKLNLLQSVHSNPPYYSEAAIYSPNVQGIIGRLMIDPFTLLLTSTNAKDYQALEDRMARGMSVTEAINNVLQEMRSDYKLMLIDFAHYLYRKQILVLFLVLSLILILSGNMVLANINKEMKIKDYGSKGHVFPIIEKSLLEIIKEKLAKIEQEGNLEKLQEIFRNKVRQKIANPIEVSNITIATENSSRFYDPTIVQKEAIKDHKGKVIVEAGTKINPLDKIEWGQALIFIDGKNPEQIAWAKSKLGKLTLIKGSPIDLSKELNRPIYFDQGGALVKRFNIRAVPAVITQEGKLLKIMEVAL